MQGRGPKIDFSNPGMSDQEFLELAKSDSTVYMAESAKDAFAWQSKHKIGEVMCARYGYKDHYYVRADFLL